MTASKRRRFEKFVALNKRGVPLWGTMANTPEEAQEHHDRYNPDPTGEGMGETIAQLSIDMKTLV